jgi:hypothetical protein
MSLRTRIARIAQDIADSQSRTLDTSQTKLIQQQVSATYTIISQNPDGSYQATGTDGTEVTVTNVGQKYYGPGDTAVNFGNGLII